MAGEPGVPYRADTGGGTSNAPDLRAPLGAPNILRPEDFIAMANFNDPTVALANAAKLTSSLIDNHYTNQIRLAQSQADLQYSAARTRSLDTDTDIIQRTADDKVDQEHLLTQLKQQEYDQAARLNPLIVQEKKSDIKTKELGVDDLQRQSDDNAAALNALPAAIKTLPSPDDPDYITKREQFRIQNSNLFTNSRTAKQMQNAYDANDQLYQAKLSTQNTVANRKEFVDMQQGGFLNKRLAPDRMMLDPNLEDTMVGGRMNRSRHALEVMTASLPDGDPMKPQMQAIVDKADGYIKDENGVKNVQAGRAAEIFDTNGDLSATQQGMANRVQAHITDLVKNGVIKPTSDLEIGLGQPDSKGEYPQKMKVTGTADIIDAWRKKLGLQTSQEIEAAEQVKKDAEAVKNQATTDPRVQAIWSQYRDNKISRDEAVKQVDQVMHPGGNQTPYGPGNPSTAPAPRAASGPTPGSTPMSNNDYRVPGNASNHAGINANVWANVMSEEGREFGKDGSHDSVFGLWADKPGIEGQAYQAVKDNGPDSLAAYDAVTNAWTNKFLRESQPWNLTSPGLQEMVIADSQHQGGAAARAIIDQMGGYDKVNAMPADQAIREYSEARKPLWPGNNKPFPNGATDRVTRERDWALRHNDELAGAGSRTQGQASAMPVHASGHPMPRTPREAMTLGPGARFMAPDGTLRMVPNIPQYA